MNAPSPARIATTLCLILGLAGCAAPVPSLAAPPVEVAPGQGERDTSQWNLATDDTSGARIAIQGYDPVAYFPEGGGTPAPGDPGISAQYGGATYLFANGENRARFVANPSRYEPAYGGWCAWAMANDVRYGIDPNRFLLQQDRLLLFYPGTEADWQAGDPGGLSDRADVYWSRLMMEQAAGN